MSLWSRSLVCAAGLLAGALPALSQTDPAAALEPRAIAERALARRREEFGAIGTLGYDVFLKTVARDPERPARSAGSVRFVAETRSSVYWISSDRYQETVLARRQTIGRGDPGGLVGVADIVSLGPDAVTLEAYQPPGLGGGERGRLPTRVRRGRFARRFTLPLPMADEASRHYVFRLLDTVAVAGRRAFRLAVIPRSNATPLFVGSMDVADSTWDVLAVDLGVNDAVALASVRDLRFRMRFADAGGGRWLPVEVRLTGEVRPNVRVGGVPREIAGIRVSGLPERFTFEQTASFDAFRFDRGDPPWGFGEYRIVVLDTAERRPGDSIAGWDEPAQADSLEDAERAAWVRSDSLARHPPALVRAGASVRAVVRIAADPGYFHFDRADGLYLGVSPVLRPSRDLIVSPRVGYAWGREAWSYHVGVQQRLSEEERRWVGVEVHDEALSRSTLISRAYNPTFRALVARVDPLDYYRERGFSLSLGTRLLDRTRLDVQYLDGTQSSLDTVPGYSLRSSRYPPRPNPPIVPGHLRALSATVSFDSRLLQRRAGEDDWLSSGSWTRLTLGLELAAPSLIPDDFAYRRYTAQIVRQQPTLGLGVTTVTVAGGIATGQVPPQRYFMVDFGMDVLAVEGSGFRTLGRTNYYGTRAAMLLVRHDFDRVLFARSGIPLLRSLPFTLGVDGGVFWTALGSQATNPGDSLLATASRPYEEIGVSLGNLTPFLSPFNLSVHAAWQLSSYATRRFRFSIGITGP